MMEALLTNKLLVIKNPSAEFRSHVNILLSYTDKSKTYQLKRMERNSFLRNSPQYDILKKEAKGQVYKELPGGHLAMSSSFAYLLKSLDIKITDQRKETGERIAYPWKKKPFDLREYQEEAADLMEESFRGVINFATGLGKTLTAIHAIRRIHKKSLIVVPSESIAKQFISELESAFGPGKVALFSGKKKKTADITVGIAASVSKATAKFKEMNLGLIIFDEVHHIAANTFFNIANDLGDVGKIFGLTATDYRSDGKDIMITAGCGNTIIKRDILWGIQNGWLAKPIFMVRRVPTTGKQFKGNKLKNYKAHVLNDKLMKETIEEDIRNAISKNKSVLCLVNEVEHGEELAANLGLPFATGKDKNSQDYVDALNAGTIDGLIGTGGKVGEGTDTKRVDVLIMGNFIVAKGNVMQAIGRGLRKYGNKTQCIIIDYIPEGSDMLARHAMQRVAIYREISDQVMIV